MDRSGIESGAADTYPLAARILVPQFSDLLYVLAAPSTYAIVAGPLLIGAAKVFVLRDIAHIEPWPYLVPRVVALDVAVFLAAGAIVASVESRHKGLRILMLPVVTALFALSIANAFYLTVAGEQLAVQSLGTGVNRFGDVALIVGEVLKWIPPVVTATVAAVLVVPWWLARTIRRKVVLPDHPGAGTRRARFTAAAAVVALLTWIASPDSTAMPVRALQRNVLMQIAIGQAGVEYPLASRPQSARRHPVADAPVEALANRRGPNVVMIVVESLRRQSTSLAEGSRVDTPTLRSLAARGLNVIGARAAVPHTTKSLWTMLCGRWPALRPDVAEATARIDAPCLPRLLHGAGYRTAFFQSAFGTFEERPRLVSNLGFGAFAAWEDIGGQRLGYLASDDESLVQPLEQFISAVPDQPFAVVLLTSATHHFYQLSDASSDRAAAANRSRATREDRYERLVETADVLLARLIDLLNARRLTSDTLVLVVGDHGEGFGDQGVRQHDSNYFEEGLNVPWVMVGPGVPRGTITGDYSLLDVMPTVLDLLGVKGVAGEGLAGRSLLSTASAGAPRPFVCWFDLKCRGYVHAGVKVVHEPMFGESFAFELARDPHERHARPLTTAELRTLLEVERSLAEQHEPSVTAPWPRVDTYPNWSCNEGKPCRHVRLN